MTVIAIRKTLQTFVSISSKNSASGLPFELRGLRALSQLSPCTVTAFHVLSWPSHSAGMTSHAFVSPSPTCITKASQSRNSYSSCTNLLPWYNLCNETFHVEFFFSANNFPSPPPSHDANRIFCPKNIGIMPILGIRAPPPSPPQHFSRALALVRVIPPLPKRIKSM